ncbi:hypothetical protein NXY56_000067 [Leishmania guyanensis]
MASVAPADPRSGAAAAGVGIATTTTLTSPAKLNSIVFVPKTGSALAHGTATNYGFHDAPTTTTISNGGGTGAITNEQSKMLARVLTKLPDLDLGEMSRVKSCFSAVLGEGRENVVNGLELRLVLGELGLYPSEAELNLILRAYRGRVNLVTLTQYLRLYKKEFWINRTAAAAAAAAVARGVDAKQMPSQSIALHSYKPFSGSQPMAAARAGAFGVCGGGDEDTLKAFVALGASVAHLLSHVYVGYDGIHTHTHTQHSTASSSSSVATRHTYLYRYTCMHLYAAGRDHQEGGT